MPQIENLIRLGVKTLGSTLHQEEEEIIRSSFLFVDGKPAIRYTYSAREGRLTLLYSLEGTPHKEEVEIEQRCSNLGIPGNYYYFICPATGARCRFLYLYGGRFVSRKALPRGVFYASQGYSRKLYKMLDTMFKAEDSIKRYGKEYYRGRLTPYGKRLSRYYSLVKRQQEAASREVL